MPTTGFGIALKRNEIDRGTTNPNPNTNREKIYEDIRDDTDRGHAAWRRRPHAARRAC